MWYVPSVLVADPNLAVRHRQKLNPVCATHQAVCIDMPCKFLARMVIKDTTAGISHKTMRLYIPFNLTKLMSKKTSLCIPMYANV